MKYNRLPCRAADDDFGHNQFHGGMRASGGSNSPGNVTMGDVLCPSSSGKGWSRSLQCARSYLGGQVKTEIVGDRLRTREMLDTASKFGVERAKYI